MSIPRWICIRVLNFVPIGPVVGSFRRSINWWPPNPHARRVSRGYILAIVHSLMNMHTCAKFGPDRYSSLASFPHFWICYPLTPSKFPLGIDGLIYLACVHSLVYLYTCAKFGPARSSGLEAFPDLWIDDPITQPCHSDIKGLLVLARAHSQMNMHTCAKFGPDRSSCLVYFQHFCMCDLLTSSKYPLGLEFNFFRQCPFQD